MSSICDVIFVGGGSRKCDPALQRREKGSKKTKFCVLHCDGYKTGNAKSWYSDRGGGVWNTL